jgi:5-formyltetrahydrofolate cyclo-ligase
LKLLTQPHFLAIFRVPSAIEMPQFKQLVVQGLSLLNVSKQTSKEMITAAAIKYGSDGAYTTARTVGENQSTSILEFDFQVQRLNDTAALLSTSTEKDNNIKESHRLSRVDVAQTIATAFSHFDTHFPSDKGERRITLLLPNLDNNTTTSTSSTDPEATPASHLYCHVELLPSPATPPIVVEICGKPRDNPLAKNVEWIAERKGLEERISNQINIHEVILSSASIDINDQPLSQVVEGTQTNVFVVTKDGVVRTAGDGVLEGSIRKMVIEECKTRDIPLDMSSPPEIATMNEWNEMFLTSTSRLVLPVDQVIVNTDSEAYPAALRAVASSRNENIAGTIMNNRDKSIVHTFESTKRPITDQLVTGVQMALLKESVDVVKLSKDALRKKIRKRLRNLSETDVDRQSKLIANHVMKMNEFILSNGIGIFLSMKNEVDTGYLLSDLFNIDAYDVGTGGEYNEKRRKVYIPKVTNFNGSMDMLRVSGGWSEICSFERNRWNIPEPSEEQALRMENALQVNCRESLLDMDVVIVPGVAFDINGQRCGHGGGFYDRFIDELQRKRVNLGQKKATLIGVTLEEQIVDRVITGRCDAIMDYVVSSTGIIKM